MWDKIIYLQLRELKKNFCDFYATGQRSFKKYYRLFPRLFNLYTYITQSVNTLTQS